MIINAKDGKRKIKKEHQNLPDDVIQIKDISFKQLSANHSQIYNNKGYLVYFTGTTNKRKAR